MEVLIVINSKLIMMMKITKHLMKNQSRIKILKVTMIHNMMTKTK